MTPSWRSLLAVCAVPALLLLALQLRALEYEFVWTDHAEIEAGSLVRPPGQWLEAFSEPLHRVDELRGRLVR